MAREQPPGNADIFHEHTAGFVHRLHLAVGAHAGRMDRMLLLPQELGRKPVAQAAGRGLQGQSEDSLVSAPV